MSSGSREMITAVMGLVTLLLALVLGALVGSAYGFYSSQRSELESLSARQIQLDVALAQYGPETKPIRDRMKMMASQAYETFWHSDDVDPRAESVAAYMPNLKSLSEAITLLNPTTATQQRLISTIESHADAIEQTRLLMSLQLASPVSWPILIVIVSWALLLFCGFGILSGLNATSVIALGFGAFAVASAVFLILELNAPFTSLFRISPAALEQTLAVIDR
jgi:hypothetical protein